MRVNRQWIRTISILLATLIVCIVFIFMCIGFSRLLKNDGELVKEPITLKSEVERVVNDHSYDDKFISEVLLEEWAPWVFDEDSEQIKSMEHPDIEWSMANYKIDNGDINNTYYLESGKFKLSDGTEKVASFITDEINITNSILYFDELNGTSDTCDINITNSIVIFDTEETNFDLNKITNSIVVFKREDMFDFESTLFNNSILAQDYEGESYYRGEEINNNSFIDIKETPI